MKLHGTSTVASIAAALALTTACSNTQQQTTVRSSPSPAATSGPTSDIGRTAGEAADKVAATAKEVAGEVKEGAKQVGAEVGVQKQVLDVKTALMADKAIDASKIDVDGDAAAKTVTLNGSVPSGAQKLAAGKLAREKAEGYTVRNNLTILK